MAEDGIGAVAEVVEPVNSDIDGGNQQSQQARTMASQISKRAKATAKTTATSRTR